MIYNPEEDTFFLLDHVEPRGRVLEMGAGSGYISAALAKKGYDVTAVDIDDEAVEKIKNGYPNVKVIKSNLFSNVNGKFDTIIFNPPYLPGDVEEDRTIFGGYRGQEIIELFLERVNEHLEKNGKIFIILSSYNDIDHLSNKFKQFCFKRLAEKKFAFHSIYAYVLWRREDEDAC